MGQGFVSIRKRYGAAVLATLLVAGSCTPREPTPEEFEEGIWNASLADLASVLVDTSTPEQLAVTVTARNLGPGDSVDVVTRVTVVGGMFGPVPSGCVSLEPTVAACTYNVEYEVLPKTSTSPATLPIIASPGEPEVTVTAKTTFGDKYTYNDPNHANDTATLKLKVQVAR
jgi:hypothetical protein